MQIKITKTAEEAAKHRTVNDEIKKACESCPACKSNATFINPPLALRAHKRKCECANCGTKWEVRL
jgi:DNA-directed RNA polymerase subunit M/transcription elongation factor TFIIS